jgi:hypothetical protein
VLLIHFGQLCILRQYLVVVFERCKVSRPNLCSQAVCIRGKFIRFLIVNQRGLELSLVNVFAILRTLFVNLSETHVSDLKLTGLPLI